MKTKRQLEEENARMRKALEELKADLEKLGRSTDGLQVHRFVGGAGVIVCRGLDIPLYIDGRCRFDNQ